MTRKALLVLLPLALAAGGLAFWRHGEGASAPIRVLLLRLGPAPGLSPAAAEAMDALLMDELESRGDLAVTPLNSLPQPYMPQGHLLVLRPAAARQGDLLALSFEWAEMGPGHEGAWHGAAGPPLPPADAMDKALGALPLSLSPRDPGLLPRKAASFWQLLEVDGAVYSNQDLDAALDAAQRLSTAEPGCAFLQATVAHIDTIRMLQNPAPLDGHVDFALAAADRAMALSPGYPRALRYAARLLSDQGHQGEALDRLQAGMRLHPQSLNLLLALDYAARTAGLLDIALAARGRMQALWSGWPERPPTGFTYLYSGRPADFEASFRPMPGTPLDGFTAFNQGYAELMDGQRPEAARSFLAAEQDPAAEGHFRALAKVYRFGIEGKSGEAAAALEALDRSRVGLQVPDGEFTFTMAEAAGFLGEQGRAMDLAQRAFSQGFTCSAWYRTSPFMAQVQPLPRWRAILQHVDERRERVGAHRRPSDFGL